MSTARNEGGFVYDVAFSYAGEDREYVERVAKAVEGRIRIFYDRHEQIDLWGKDLHTHLTEIYGKESRLCVMFLSRHYASKVWTTHEREIAQARAYRENQTYILPARFDDTFIPEALDTVAYVDLRSLTPEAFAELLVEKVRATARAQPRERRPWLALASAALVAGLVLGGAAATILASGARAAQKRPEAGLAARDPGHLAPDQEPAPAARPQPRSAPAPETAPRSAGHRAPRARQVLRSDGAGSRAEVDGSMKLRPGGSGDAIQEVSAARGGVTHVKGDLILGDESGQDAQRALEGPE